MGTLKINRVKYFGDNYTFESPELTDGLNIIEGNNGSGKTTFMNLIYYGLSGKVDEFSPSNRSTHAEITGDRHNYVLLEVSINEKNYKLIRYLNKNDITVLGDDSKATVYQITRTKNEQNIFSDWILSELDVEPVDIYQGINVSKINIKDLFRLIYHNQELNPKKIYKPADLENYIADSEQTRKTIFEILVGQSYSEYYSTFTRFKQKEKDRNAAQALLNEFIAFSQEFSKGEDLNLIFLKKQKEEKYNQLDKLNIYRESLKSNEKSQNSFTQQINASRDQIITLNILKSEKYTTYNEVIDELGQLKALKESLVLEVTQISKIIHTHEKLSLFAANTCPYCLQDVERTSGHCVCGNIVKEEEYERFFYSSNEYADILKSRQKSVETINLAIDACQEQAQALHKEIKDIQNEIEAENQKINNWLKNYDFTSNSQEIKDIDDAILKIRTEINNLYQQIEIEERREKLTKSLERLEAEYTSIKGELKALEAKATLDIRNKIERFNDVYKDLMIHTLKHCRTASISYDDYMPQIDGGAYREASASVTVRLMYFLTLLKLSLENQEIKFPRFLLIDTPETAGVDDENLKNALSKIDTVTSGYTNGYQIILTTGVGKYPDTFKDSVVLSLTDQNRLLTPVNAADDDLLK